jgi:RHH-type transcriptional regulator, rel operon repressor / antitoxin RelB
MLAIRLPEDIEARLENLAKATGRTKTFYAREAILEYLEDMEDLYESEKRLLDIQAGRSKTFTLDEIKISLGLAD